MTKFTLQLIITIIVMALIIIGAGYYTTKVSSPAQINQSAISTSTSQSTASTSSENSSSTSEILTSQTITLADNNRTIDMRAGDTFLLKLGENMDWVITIDNPAIISREVNVLVIRGAQGIYRALKPGKAVLKATGDLPCRKASPPCLAPTLLFTLYVNVE